MEQNLEIEFKNLLTEAEYHTLLTTEFSTDQTKQIHQSNYYFDTKDQQLKQQHSALRIRKTDAFNELTLKVPAQGHLLETNLPLRDNTCSEILNAKKLNLSQLNADMKIENLSHDAVFYLFNQFSTVRVEKMVGDHLLVLDQTTFQNGVMDYELEIESVDATLGEQFFQGFLKKHSIALRPASPKIARAAGRTKPLS